MEEKNLIRDMTTGNPLRQLILFSLPFMLSNFLQQVYSLADMVIVGQFVGSAGLTATSNAGDIVVLYFFICMGVTTGGQIIVSQLIGSGNREKLSSAIGTLLTFVIILGAVLTAVSIALCDLTLSLINIPEESFQMAHEYFMVCCWGNVPIFGYNAISSILRGMGDSKHPTMFIAVSAVLNIVLDLIFVGGLGMSCFGAALATVIAQGVSCVVSYVFAYRHKEEFGFDFKLKSFRIDLGELKTLVGLGVPIALQNLLVMISMLFVASRINVYGVVAASVTAVGNKLGLVATVCTSALNTAGSTIVAQNFAAGKLKRVSTTLLHILLISLAFTAVLALLVVLFPEEIFGIFDPSPDVIAMSHTYVPIAVISLIGFAGRAAVFSFINGIGFASMAFFGGLLDGIIARIGLSLLFGSALGMGVFGYWLGSAVAGHTFTVIGIIYFALGTWEKRRAIV